MVVKIAKPILASAAPIVSSINSGATVEVRGRE